jgi:hypothetical protein
MPSEVESELHRFEQIAPTLFAPEEAKLSPAKRAKRGQFPKKPRGFYVEEMRGGGLEPEKRLEMIDEFQGKCRAMWRLVA